MRNIVEHLPSIDIIDLARQGAFDEGVTMWFPFLRLTTTRHVALWARPKSPPDRPPLGQGRRYLPREHRNRLY
jgi:hypothetical protein